VDKINGVKAGIGARAAKLPENDTTRKQLDAANDKVDAIRKKIVATKEGGAITGEQRLREYTDDLYGAVSQYEGKPGDYLIERTEALHHELTDVETEFANFEKTDLAKLNETLKAKQIEPVVVPAAVPAEAAGKSGGGGR